MANDSDPKLVAGPAQGALALAPDGSFTYTPRADFSGADSFTDRARDTAGSLSNIATVGLTVNGANDPPVAADDSATTKVNITVRVDVLANDGDQDGPLAGSGVRVTVPPTRGTAQADPQTGEITYSPALNLRGSDSFTYEVCDSGGACDTAGVTFVTADASLPVVCAGDVALSEGNAGTRTAVLPVSLSRPSTSSVTVTWATANGSASAPSDFVASSGTLTVPAGARSAAARVAVKGNTRVEGPENFGVNLSSPTGAVLGDATGVSTITNDTRQPEDADHPGRITQRDGLDRGETGERSRRRRVLLRDPGESDRSDDRRPGRGG